MKETPEIAFIVIGLPRSGKTTFGNYLSDATGLKHGATSDVAFRLLADEMGCRPSGLYRLNKSSLRPGLIRVMDEYLRSDSSAHVRDLLGEGCRIFSGVRRRHELVASKLMLRSAGLNTVVLWVEKRAGDPDEDDNTEVTAGDADAVVRADNLFGLWRKALDWANVSREGLETSRSSTEGAGVA